MVKHLAALATAAALGAAALFYVTSVPDTTLPTARPQRPPQRGQRKHQPARPISWICKICCWNIPEVKCLRRPD